MPSLRGLRGTRNACLLLMLLLVSVAAAKQPLVAQSVESAPPGTQLEEEADAIVVVGERLRRARGAIGINPITGRMKCKVTNPSGDDRVDRAACDIALRCAKKDRRNRDRFTACVEAEYEAFLDAYFAEPRG